MLEVLQCIALTAGINSNNVPLKAVNRELVRSLPDLGMYPLVASIIAVESRFEPFAKSHVGAKGLGQLTPIAIREVSTEVSPIPETFNVYGIRDNIKVTISYIKHLTRKYRFGTIELLVAYNAGPSKVERLRDMVNINTETSNYVTKVMYLKSKCEGEMKR